MEYRIITIILLSITLSYNCNNQTIPAPEPISPLPNERQLAWQEMEMVAFVHFTTNTFTDLEWGNGDESESVFNPSAPDPLQWATELKNAGFKELRIISNLTVF